MTNDMKKVLLILMVLVASSAKGQILSSFPDYTPDTGTHLAGYERISGAKTNKSYSIAALKAYINSGGGGTNIATGSQTANGEYIQHWGDHELAMDNVRLRIFTKLLQSVDHLRGVGAYWQIVDSAGNNIVWISNGSGGAVDTVKLYNAYVLPQHAGASGQYVGVDAAGNWTYITPPITPVVVAQAALTAQPAAVTVCTVTPTTGGQCDVSAYVNVLNVVTDVLNMTVTFTDESGAPQTITLPMVGGTGAGGVSMGAIKFYSNRYSLNIQSGTPITVAVTVATGGGTVNYNTGATIFKY